MDQAVREQRKDNHKRQRKDDFISISAQSRWRQWFRRETC
jgi:hypothetical protein